MIAVADIIARLNAAVPGLQGRIQGAGEFSALMKSNALPQVTPAAFVVPTGLMGSAGDAITGAFTQPIERMFGVIVVLRAADRTGARAIDPLDTLIDETLAAIVGWAPGNAVGVFRLVRGNLVSLSAGTIVYQLDFALPDQLRILQ